jgi:hypothetical protein
MVIILFLSFGNFLIERIQPPRLQNRLQKYNKSAFEKADFWIKKVWRGKW